MKTNFYFLSLLMAALFVVSCGSDDSSTSNDDDGPAADTFVGDWKFAGEMWDGEFVPDEAETCDDELLNVDADFTAQIVTRECGAASETREFTWEKLDSNSYRLTVIDTEQEINIDVDFSDNGNTMTTQTATDDTPDVWERQ